MDATKPHTSFPVPPEWAGFAIAAIILLTLTYSVHYVAFLALVSAAFIVASSGWFLFGFREIFLDKQQEAFKRIAE